MPTPTPNEPSFRRERVLVLDEDGQTVALAARLGQRAEVVTVASIEAALESVFNWAFDLDLLLVVLDSTAPGPYDVVADLAVAVPGAPIVVLSEQALLREMAATRGCVGAVALDEIDGEAAYEAIVAALSEGDFRLQWAARTDQVRLLFGALDVGVLVFSPTGRVVLANLVAPELLGMSRAALLYALHPELPLCSLDGEPLGRAEQPVDAVLASGKESEPRELLVRPADGTERTLELRARPVWPPSGPMPLAVVVTLRDITEQHAAQQALVLAKRRDSLLLEHAAEGFLILDGQGRVIEASATISRYFSLGRVIGADARLLLHKDERARATAMFSVVQSRPSVPVRGELRFVDSHGATRWVELTMANCLEEPSVGGIVLNLRDITERKLAEESMARLSAIVEFSEDSIIAEDLEGLIVSWNPASQRLYGYCAAEVLGKALMELIVPPERRGELEEIRAQISAGERVERRDTLRWRKDHSEVVVALHVSPVFDATGQLVGTSSIARDITERRRIEGERSMFEERFRIGFERGAIGMAIVDLDRCYNRVNEALCVMLGRNEDELIGQPVERFVHPLESELAVQASTAQVSASVANYHAERRFLKKNGEEVWATVDSAVVTDADGEPRYVFSQFQDITDRKRSEQALAYQALHDSLTGLPNRALLCDRLSQAIERGRRNSSQAAVLFLDLDRFKLVNDSLGHGAGDRLLVDIGNRIAAALRRSDTVARFGGDEFIVMREDVDATGAVQLGNQIVGLFQSPFVVDGVEMYVTTSCGVVLVGGEATLDEALRDADAAMYRAKERGGGRLELSNPELRRAVSQRFDLERALAFAIERSEFRVVYQPIVSMTHGQLVGVEALVRWEQPQWGLLMPGEFIPAAEDTGHIAAIGEFVLREALAQVMHWRENLRGAEELWVSVNLSSRQLALADPVQLCATALSDLGAPADALRLELTESAIMEDVETAIPVLRQVRQLGVKIAIDDFGTGYSSLSYLSKLPISSLKIDHSFVWGMGPAMEDTAIVRAIVSLADTLNIEPLAEGVETEEQRLLLLGLGCMLVQGYLFAPPMRPAEFERWLGNHITPALA